jgi:Flp pilus assembly protein TadG
MTLLSVSGPLRIALHKSRTFVLCQRGIAAVEFGLIVPIMLMMFIGTVELSQAITVDRRVSQVASSTADLVARQKTLTSTTMDSFMEIITQLMSPYSATPMKITVSNVYATVAAPTAYKVCWVYQYNTGADTSLTAGGTYPSTGLPAGIVQGGTSVVVVDVSYAYTPVVMFHGATARLGGGTYVGTGYTFTEKFFLKPRLSASIQYGSIAACV